MAFQAWAGSRTLNDNNGFMDLRELVGVMEGFQKPFPSLNIASRPGDSNSIKGGYSEYVTGHDLLHRASVIYIS